MKSSELIQLIQKIDPEGKLEVVIPLSRGVGGPCVIIKSAYKGFDWYAGKLCLSCTPNVVSIDMFDHTKDMCENATHTIYCKFADEIPLAFVSSRKPPLKVGQEIEIRKIASKEKHKVEVLEVVQNHCLPKPLVKVKEIKSACNHLCR